MTSDADHALALHTTARQLVATWQDAKQAIIEGFAQIEVSV